MEELLELRKCLEEEDYIKALEIVGELEEMSKEDKINKIYSYLVVLLTHLIKQEVEKRSTRSWDVSIKNSLRQINRTNKRRKSGGFYLSDEEMRETIREALLSAIDKASLEVREGLYNTGELIRLLDTKELNERAFRMVENQKKL